MDQGRWDAAVDRESKVILGLEYAIVLGGMAVLALLYSDRTCWGVAQEAQVRILGDNAIDAA